MVNVITVNETFQQADSDRRANLCIGRLAPPKAVEIKKYMSQAPVKLG